MITPSNLSGKIHWHRFRLALAAALACAYLVIMLITGALPQSRQFVKSEAKGVLELAPETISRVVITADGQTLTLRRQAQGWQLQSDVDRPLDAAFIETLERAVKFMHTANPVRVLSAEDIQAANWQDFGLDPPQLSVLLGNADGTVLEADFGNHNSDGFLQFIRLKNSETLYLMSNFVGKEWQTVLQQSSS